MGGDDGQDGGDDGQDEGNGGGDGAQWVHYDDRSTQRVSLERVLADRAAPYVLFYKRRAA